MGTSPNNGRRTHMSELKANNIAWMECKRTARNRTSLKGLMEDICSIKERRGQRERERF